MKLYIKQKVFSFGDKFTVKDAQGNDKYFVQGEVFSWGKKLHIFDNAGREVAFIKQEVWSLMPRFYVLIDNEVVAEIVKKFTFFVSEYTIDPMGWKVYGQIMDHDYEIKKGNKTVVRIRKEWFTWGDSYELNIADEKDEILALAVVLVIDCVIANQNSTAHNTN